MKNKTETPIFDFVKDYADRNNLRLHMPGHKGKGLLGFEKWDITEIDGADVLYGANGIIKESQGNAAALFKTKKTLFSAEGSSLAIRAVLFLIKTYALSQGQNPLVFAGRNAHKTFVTACALMDIGVEWLLPADTKTVMSCEISADFLDSCLSALQQKPTAVYITSPDYLGNMSDIAALSKVCRKHGVLLAVDNAHGAYLKFLPDDMHPISLGADICCDSAHKTLPVLTGGAYLHISDSAPEMFSERAMSAMSFFASTSPSYLILASLDAANAYISGDYRQNLSDFVCRVNDLKAELVCHGYELCGNEPMKLNIAPKSFGYTGTQLAQILSQKNIECEFSDPDFIVFMFTPQTGSDGIEALKRALLSLERRKPITTAPPAPKIKNQKLSLKDAVFSPSVLLPTEKCLGKTAADISVNCPPAVPIVMCGEEIDRDAVESFKYYGIKECRVIKEKGF